MPSALSISEQHGLDALPEDAITIYSVGISAAANAELEMVKRNPARHVIATNTSAEGLHLAKDVIAKQNTSDTIEVKLEDIAKPLPYANATFDYVYARLVLQYLDKQELENALTELYRVLKPGCKLFAVVRSTECSEATQDGSRYDDQTGLTTYISTQTDGSIQEFRRFFHTTESISNFMMQAGFEIEHVEQYDEELDRDFNRSDRERSPYVNNLIELIARKPS